MGFYNYKNNLEFKRDIFCAENIEQKHRLTYKTVLGKKSNSFLELPRFLELLKGATQTFQTFQNWRKANNKKKTILKLKFLKF